MSKNILVGIVVFLVGVGVVAYFLVPPPEDASVGMATPGLAALNASSSAMTAGATAVTIFAPQASCVSRIVSVGDVPIMIVFGEASTTFNPNDASGSGYGVSSTTVTGAIGNVQGASTTVAYDSGLYGCGLWSAISGQGAAAAANITVTELR